MKLFAAVARTMKNNFLSLLKECLGEETESKQVKSYSISEYGKLLRQLVNIPGTVVDLEVFYLQAKMNGIYIEDTMRAQIECEWKFVQELECVKKELQNNYKNIFAQRLAEEINEMTLQIDDYKNKNDDLKSINLKLKEDIVSKQKEIDMLKSSNEKTKIELKESQKIVTEIDKEIINLKEQTKELKLTIEGLSEKLREKEEVVFIKIQLKWENENKDKVKENKELDLQITKGREEIIEIENKKKNLESIVLDWNEYIDTYLSKIDYTIIERRIDSILYKNYDSKVVSQVAATKENTNDTGSLYIMKGNDIKNSANCRDYDQYVDIVENNLLNIGIKNPKGMINDCFNAAINSGLCPLICGYGARELAMALIASKYSEKPEIISMPAGYGNIKELVNAIELSETSTVIVEDVFGRMNEGVILPILRDTFGKTIIFTAESIDDLMHLQMHYFNYLQLIVFDKRINIKTNNFIYADAKEIFSSNIYTGKEKGYKIARQVFDCIGMDYTYILTRGNVMCELLVACMDNTEEDALIKLFTTELKWILGEEKKNKLIEYFEGSEGRYSKKIIECIG